jgi:hypothetical protein
VDNIEVARQTIPHTIPFLMTVDETFDVGLDTRTGVDDTDYKPPFRFNGKVNKVTFNLGPVVLSEPERKAMHESIIKAKAKTADHRGHRGKGFTPGMLDALSVCTTLKFSLMQHSSPASWGKRKRPKRAKLARGGASGDASESRNAE